jgi:hypothetical protein
LDFGGGHGSRGESYDEILDYRDNSSGSLL